jgi:hypothetical protein
MNPIEIIKKYINMMWVATPDEESAMADPVLSATLSHSFASYCFSEGGGGTISALE